MRLDLIKRVREKREAINNVIRDCKILYEGSSKDEGNESRDYLGSDWEDEPPSWLNEPPEWGNEPPIWLNTPPPWGK